MENTVGDRLCSPYYQNQATPTLTQPRLTSVPQQRNNAAMTMMRMFLLVTPKYWECPKYLLASCSYGNSSKKRAVGSMGREYC